MALPPQTFEFIDCATISISYDRTGIANVSFTVVSTFPVPGQNPPRDFTNLTFGQINFSGFITQLESNVILGSIPVVFEHKFTLSMTGCAADCPRGNLIGV